MGFLVPALSLGPQVLTGKTEQLSVQNFPCHWKNSPESCGLGLRIHTISCLLGFFLLVFFFKQASKKNSVRVWANVSAVVATASEFYRIDDPTLSHRFVCCSLPLDVGGRSL